LALAFKHTGRATLIGETTAGANHFGGFERIGGGLAVFLPVGRTIDPATGKDWEGTGIVPDVAVAPTLALQEALERAGAIG
jgi:C-terminal processing protease CtpA/Prc